jgi:hypothetical protein
MAENIVGEFCFPNNSSVIINDSPCTSKYILPNPTSIVLADKDAKITIDIATGNVTLENCNLNEASKMFWDMVKQLVKQETNR